MLPYRNSVLKWHKVLLQCQETWLQCANRVTLWFLFYFNTQETENHLFIEAAFLRKRPCKSFLCLSVALAVWLNSSPLLLARPRVCKRAAAGSQGSFSSLPTPVLPHQLPLHVLYLFFPLLLSLNSFSLVAKQQLGRQRTQVRFLRSLASQL